MSESEGYPKAEFSRKPNVSEYLSNVPKCGLNTRHDNREVTWSDTYSIFPKAEFVRICPNIYRMFRSVDWTHDIITVKWHLFIYSFDTSANFALWQMRHRFNPRIRVNDQRYSMLTVLPLRSMSCTFGNSFIFALSCRRRWFLQVLPSIRSIFWKNFFVSDDDKCYGENMSQPQNYKNSNLIQAMKNNVCPKATVIRRPNFSENRICPKIHRMFRSVDWTHDMIIVKWHLFIWHEFDTSGNFALWQMRHRFNPRKRVNDYQRYSMLTVLPLRSMSCTLGNSSSL